MNFSYNKQRLRLSSPSFDEAKINRDIDKLFDQTQKESYNNFIQNPSNKTFEDLTKFIELSPAVSSINIPPIVKPPASPVDAALVESFCIKQTRLNQLERDQSNENFFSEIQNFTFKELEKKGKCLTNLIVSQMKQGPNNQILFYMIDCDQDIEAVHKKFQNHNLAIDDRVAFCVKDKSPIVDAYGYVYQLLHNGVVVSIVEAVPFNYLLQRFSLVKQDYQAAFQVNSDTLYNIRTISQAPGAQRELLEDLLRDSLEDKENEALDLSDYDNLELFDQHLNHYQIKAVKSALAAKNMYLIDGPAGTGKTRVIAEFIYQCAKKGLKVLACAPNHVAVDNIVERLLDRNIKCCRLGRPASFDPKIDRVSLDEMVRMNKRIKLIEEECNKILEALRNIHNDEERRALLSQIEINKRIISLYQKNVGQLILYYSNVVFSTLQGTASTLLEDNKFFFDVVVIDECSQATEIASWAAILKAKKVIIAGDRLQLPPFIVNQDAQRLGFAFTLFDRLRTKLPKNLRQILRIQYRMNEQIMAWSNEQFYRRKLKANDVCAQYTLDEYTKEDSIIKQRKEKVVVLMLVNTAGFDFVERTYGHSYLNIGEGVLVLSLIDELFANFNLKPDDIGVISPYEAQYEMIAKAMEQNPRMKGIKCHSVDQFQGKEKEVIIISLVRSNQDKKVGFLDNKKRMNVSVTRARRFVAIICDQSTICKPDLPFLVALVQHFKQHGQVRTPDQFGNLKQYIEVLKETMGLKGKILGLEAAIQVMQARNEDINKGNRGVQAEQEEEKEIAKAQNQQNDHLDNNKPQYYKPWTGSQNVDSSIKKEIPNELEMKEEIKVDADGKNVPPKFEYQANDIKVEQKVSQNGVSAWQAPLKKIAKHEEGHGANKLESRVQVSQQVNGNSSGKKNGLNKPDIIEEVKIDANGSANEWKSASNHTDKKTFSSNNNMRMEQKPKVEVNGEYKGKSNYVNNKNQGPKPNAQQQGSNKKQFNVSDSEFPQLR